MMENDTRSADTWLGHTSTRVMIHAMLRERARVREAFDAADRDGLDAGEAILRDIWDVPTDEKIDALLRGAGAR